MVPGLPAAQGAAGCLLKRRTSIESKNMSEDGFADRKHSAGGGMWVAWVLAGVAVLVQMLTNGRYGYFRDEFYYLAASDHLFFGYAILPL